MMWPACFVLALCSHNRLAKQSKGSHLMPGVLIHHMILSLKVTAGPQESPQVKVPINKTNFSLML